MTAPDAGTSRPDPERLLGVRVSATEDGGAFLVIHTRGADGALYEGELTAEPYVADMLRRAVLHAIPDRPTAPADLPEIQRRMGRIFEARP